MYPLVINRALAFFLTLFILAANPAEVISQHFSFTEVPDIWYNSQLTPEILESYRYASVDVYMVNPTAFRRLKFFPPKPKDGEAKKEWERKFNGVKDMKYLCANIVFPAAESPWNSDLTMPLYLFDLENNIGFFGNDGSANVINRIPRQNEYFNRLKASLKLENIEKEKLENFAGEVNDNISPVVTFVKENPMGGSTEFAIALQRKCSGFGYQAGMKKQYEFSYDLQLYPFGAYDDGIIQQIDVYTIVPSDLGNKNYPKLEKSIASFESVDEVIKSLNNEGTLFPQFLVVYRIHRHDYNYFNTKIAEDIIEEQATELKNLATYGFISNEEYELWSDLITLKRMILSMSDNSIEPYYAHTIEQEPYAEDLMNIIEDYRNINLKLMEFDHKYQDSKLYQEHFKRHFSTMQRKADGYLLDAQNNPTLENAYYFVQALLERKSQTPINKLSDKYAAVQILDFLQKEAARMRDRGEEGYRVLENALYYDLANLHVLVLEKEIYSEKYQDRVEDLKKLGEKESSYMELSSVLEKNTEACTYCKDQIRSALAKYQEDKNLEELEMMSRNYQYIKRNLLKEVLDLKNEIYCIERILDSPDFVAGNGPIIKDYKAHLFSWRELTVKLENLSRMEVDTAEKDALKQFHQEYNDIWKLINNLRFVFEDRQKDFGTCFSKEEIRP